MTDEMIPDTSEGAEGGLPDVARSGLRIVDSSMLFGADTEVLIRHEGELYRIRITRRGRLILQK